MAEQQSIITAIRDSEAEGFVTSTLFSQGWDIHFRSLDFASLLTHAQTKDCKTSQVLISTDCEGISESNLVELQPLVQKIILFRTDSRSQDEFAEAVELPKTSLELISLIRGSLRSPMIRSNKVAARTRHARVIAITGVSGGVGCSTLAYNLAAELSALGTRVLLVDADSISPSLAALLGQRGLATPGNIRSISPTFSAFELTEENIVQSLSLLESALTDFEFVILDLGMVTEISQQLSGRRWSGQALAWVSNYADSLFVLSPTDRVGLERLKVLVTELATNAMRPTFSFLQVLRQQGKRDQSGTDKFLQIVTAIRPAKISELPFDSRAVLKAELQESSLSDSNDRGALRKAIAELAGELAS